MRPRAFFELAKYLAHQQSLPGGEAAIRSAVSRAYYGALHHVRKRMEEWGCDFLEKRGTHAKVIQGLRCSGVTALILLADDLDAFRRRREKADYDIEACRSSDWDWLVVAKHYDKALQVDNEWGALDEEGMRRALDGMQNKIKRIEHPRR